MKAYKSVLKGYKIVRNIYGELRSEFADVESDSPLEAKGIVYVPGRYVKPVKNCGDLFVWKVNPLKGYDYLNGLEELWEIEYIPSKNPRVGGKHMIDGLHAPDWVSRIKEYEKGDLDFATEVKLLRRIQ